MKNKIDDSVILALYALWFAGSILIIVLGQTIGNFIVASIGGGMLGSIVVNFISMLIKRCA